jgi:hypothetical protein
VVSAEALLVHESFEEFVSEPSEFRPYYKHLMSAVLALLMEIVSGAESCECMEAAVRRILEEQSGVDGLIRRMREA